MRITRTSRVTAGLAALVAALAAGAPGAASAPSDVPVGAVFMVNPVQSSGDQTLTDQKDAADAVPASAYAEVPLRHLDGSGYLRGDWVVVESATGKPAYSSAGQFHYDRSQDQFEQVMGYFWVNQTQEYLQSLGFGAPGSDLPGIIDEPFTVKINQYGGDNSYQTDKPYRIRLGKGGVDDAEDAEVIVHEYGHAVHADQVEGYGQSLDAGAIGESFGDYLAVTVGLDAADQYAWPVRTETPGELERGWDAEACVMDWDATSYSQSPVAKCLRRIDQDFTLADRQGQVHFDGMIWSRALWDVRSDYEVLGMTTRDWDTTLIASQFDYAPDTSFQDAAAQTWATARDRDGEAAADAVRQRFAERGITFE